MGEELAAMEDRVHWAICLGVERLLNQLQLMLKLPKPATASPPVPVDVAKQVPASISSTSSNNYMRADGQNTGNFITVVHKKTASVLCVATVKNEDKLEFSKILEAIKANFNDKYDEYRKKWGGGIMGSKSQAKTKAKERLLAKEAAQRRVMIMCFLFNLDMIVRSCYLLHFCWLKFILINCRGFVPRVVSISAHELLSVHCS
ncbi:uncharacterized protein LOC133877036 [Alnus glutinosa]|uniref:uncharacterized protein LOC133877036 n=1 Tax=Alnus glutinosa TaxID=3517 RepID=UPI002D76B2BF|nr:uncharacterized protein LOC133877036 [Alnus glutinosa]